MGDVVDLAEARRKRAERLAALEVESLSVECLEENIAKLKQWAAELEQTLTSESKEDKDE